MTSLLPCDIIVPQESNAPMTTYDYCQHDFHNYYRKENKTLFLFSLVIFLPCDSVRSQMLVIERYEQGLHCWRCLGGSSRWRSYKTPGDKQLTEHFCFSPVIFYWEAVAERSARIPSGPGVLNESRLYQLTASLIAECPKITHMLSSCLSVSHNFSNSGHGEHRGTQHGPVRKTHHGVSKKTYRRFGSLTR